MERVAAADRAVTAGLGPLRLRIRSEGTAQDCKRGLASSERARRSLLHVYDVLLNAIAQAAGIVIEVGVSES